MLVVIGVIGLTLPAFFSIFFSLLRQQAKIYALSQVKREGDFILNSINNTIKNYGVSIHSSTPPSDSNKINCLTPTPILGAFFLDRFGNYFRLCKSSAGANCDNGDNFIASSSPILSPTLIPLNTAQIKITNFNLTCYQSSPFSPPIIKLIFTVTYKTASNRPEDTASLTYQTQIKMKSY